jgi:hypothetical protein
MRFLSTAILFRKMFSGIQCIFCHFCVRIDKIFMIGKVIEMVYDGS